MSKKTLEDYKNEIEDKIRSLVRQRNEHVAQVNKLDSELAILMEQNFNLDESKVKVTCQKCKNSAALGTIKDPATGKLVVCDWCGGKGYRWEEKFIEPVSTEKKDEIRKTST